MKDKTLLRVFALFALIFAVLVAVAVHAVRNINRAATTSDWVNGTHALINELAGLAASLQSGEGNLRLYSQSGDPRDQAACRQAHALVADHLEVVKALTRAAPDQHGRVLQVETLANARTDFAGEVIRARSEGRLEAVASLLAADAGSAALSGVLGEIRKLRSEAMNLLAERDKRAYLQAQATRWTVWTGVGINFVLLAGAAWLVFSDIRFRRQAAESLQKANDRLEARVAERTADLSRANDQLSLDNLERRWGNQALEHQLHYDRLIINAVSELIVVVTKARNISRINPAVTRLTGWEAPELVNRPLTDLVRLLPGKGEGLPVVADPVDHAIEAGHELREQPASIRDRHGRDCTVRLALVPLRDGNKIVGAVVTMRTERTPNSPGA